MKRGPYKTKSVLEPDSSSSPYSEKSWSQINGNDKTEGWSTADFYDRPTRSAKRKVNYREAEQYEEESASSDSDDEEATPKKSREVKPVPKSKHAPLFQMVLHSMHGDLEVPADQPSLRDLAAICTELLDMEHRNIKPDPIMFLDPFEADRYANNVTPAPSPVLRDVPTPPSTPLSYKPHVRPYSGAIFAPVPLTTRIPNYSQMQYSGY